MERSNARNLHRCCRQRRHPQMVPAMNPQIAEIRSLRRTTSFKTTRARVHRLLTMILILMMTMYSYTRRRCDPTARKAIKICCAKPKGRKTQLVIYDSSTGASASSCYKRKELKEDPQRGEDPGPGQTGWLVTMHTANGKAKGLEWSR